MMLPFFWEHFTKEHTFAAGPLPGLTYEKLLKRSISNASIKTFPWFGPTRRAGHTLPH